MVPPVPVVQLFRSVHLSIRLYLFMNASD
jgi:hypothetical protein